METQKCLYEILGVERTDSQDDIRSAYRKLALKWHPDKIQQSGASPEECQDATIRFQEIGRAYEVLADPAERSWYDSHRSQILSASSSSSSDYDFNPWPYFSPSVYAGYGDTGKGFYAVYGDLFAKLYQQERDFAQFNGLDPPYHPPDMGGPSTPYSQVQKFYSHWLGFSTLKDFAWCDEYRASAGPNRKLRRLMEEENKKIRAKARKEFNEAVRRLTAFVKKRDKRVLKRQLEIQRQEKEKEEKLKLRKKKEEEEKIMKLKLYQEAEWTKVSTEEYEANDSSDVDDSIGSYSWDSTASKNGDRKKERQDEFYCIVCSKKFKSDKQWKNHERSRKHLDRVTDLKESFMEEDDEIKSIFLQQQPENNMTNGDMPTEKMISEAGMENALSGDSDKDIKDVKVRLVTNSGIIKAEIEDFRGKSEDEEEPNNFSKPIGAYMDKQEHHKGQDDDSENAESEVIANGMDVCREKEIEEEVGGGGEEEEEEMLTAMMKSCLSMKQLDTDNELEDDNENNELEDDNENDHFFRDDKKKKSSKSQLRTERKKNNNSKRHSALLEELSIVKEVERTASKNDTVGRDEYGASVSGVSEVTEICENRDVHNSEIPEICRIQELDRAVEICNESVDVNKQFSVNQDVKSLKGNKLVLQSDASRKSVKGKKNKGKRNVANSCETCGEDFESRNQLFKHISITNHAALKSNK